MLAIYGLQLLVSIGDTLARMLEYSKVDVLRRNHVGDWGTQVNYGFWKFLFTAWLLIAVRLWLKQKFDYSMHDRSLYMPILCLLKINNPIDCINYIYFLSLFSCISYFFLLCKAPILILGFLKIESLIGLSGSLWPAFANPSFLTYYELILTSYKGILIPYEAVQ